MDFSTLLGVLGVILTVVFFIVGYRQTIGARKERARAANKLASDAVFRRLTLETQFGADPSKISRLLSGWALEARVRATDMYTLDELHAVLLCKIVENDYLGAENRKEVMERLQTCFKDAASLPRTEEALSKFSRRGGTEIILAAASGLTAFVGTILFAFLTDRERASGRLNQSDLKTLLLIGLTVSILIIITAVVLLLFTRLRESTRATGDERMSVAQRALMAQRQFIYTAKIVNPSIVVSEREWPDIQIMDGDKKIAIEIETRLAHRSSSHVQTLLNFAEQKCDQDGFWEVLLTSPESSRLLAKLPKTNRVKIVSFSEALDRMRMIGRL